MVLPRRLPQLKFPFKPQSQGSLRASFRSRSRSRTWQQSQRRGYASGDSHETKQASSDWPWLIGATAVTIPCSYYLWPKASSPDHGHGHGDGDHAKHDVHEESEESEGVQEEGDSTESEGKEQTEADESKDEGKEEETSSDSGSDDSKQDDNPETSDDEAPQNEEYVVEGGGNVEGVQFKGATKGGTKDGEQGDTRKHIPDPKGGNKKRIESDYGNKLGDLEEEDSDGEDKAAASKPAGGFGSQSSKQEGLSNTNTKHSTDITNDPAKSKKGEGTPETSKSKGTVDPGRPQA